MGSTNLADKTNLRLKKVIVKLVAGMLVFKGAAYNTMPTSTLFMLNCIVVYSCATTPLCQRF